MTITPKHLSCRQLALASLAVLLIASVGGFFLLRRLWPDNSILINFPGRSTQGKTTPIAIPIDTGSSSQSQSGVNSGGQAAAMDYGLSIRLSQGQAQPQFVAPLPLATGEPLSAEEIQQILTRLPTLPAASGDQVEFKLAQQPIPPPRTGVIVEQAFPPPTSAPTPDVGEAGPLKVLRFSPEGEIPVAPFINITFNQPMVPLGTLGDLAAEAIPVKVEPSLPGTWRWLGTKILTFEYDSKLIDRLPKATNYRITVPAGTKSATGGVLPETVEWSFSTPPPKVVSTYPYNSPQPLDPIFFIAFDQRIEPAAVLATIKVQAGSQPVSLLLASAADLQLDKQISQMLKYTPEGRWLAFKATSPLPAATDISVTIGPGTPSAEGPLVTQEAQSFSFPTYTPLRIDDHGCYWYDNQCRPLTPFTIRFNNPIDAQAYQETMLRVEPEIPGVSVNIYGNSVEIRGATRGQTTYTVIVDGNIKDIFGQKLGKNASLTFKVGPAEPVLVGPEQIFLTIDPVATKPVFSVYSINYTQLMVKIYAVQPSDWLAFKQYLREWQQTDPPPQAMPGRLVADKALRPEAPADTLTQVDIDLSEYMDGNFGHFVVIVEPPKGLFESNDQKWKRYSQTVHAWVQITQIGLDAYFDFSEMTVWATALKTGAPLAGVTVQTGSGKAEVTTGEDGTVKLAAPAGSSYLVARLGSDQALLPRSATSWGDDTWYFQPPNDSLRWYVFDDRQIYRPGEELHIKGWVRLIGGRQDGDVGLVDEAFTQVNYQLTDPQGNALGSGQVDVNALGGFDFAFTIPQAVNLGTAQLTLTAGGGLAGIDGDQFYHSFQIQEFRTPEFEVIARNETTGPYFVGEHAVLAVEAKYYAGGPLPNADVSWQVTYAPGSYSPPNWPDFTFGTWTPWWYYDYSSPTGGDSGKNESFQDKTDASGTHYLRLDFDGNNGPRPVSIFASAAVMDVNRQAWSSSTSLLVHPANLYIGLRSDRYFVERGTPLEVDFIVTDLDGNPVSDRPAEVHAARLEWKIRGGTWQEEEVDIQKCDQGSLAEPVTCTFETTVGGVYQITASITDSFGRQNQSRFTRWVSGGQQPPSRNVEQEMVTLIPDQQTYQPGDVAQILVQSPFSPAEGLLTVSRSGILYAQRFQIKNGSVTLSVPIDDKYIPNLKIQVDLVGAAPRVSDKGEPMPDVPPRPAYASGQLNLSIPPLQRTLSLQVTPDQKELEPGGETTLTIVLKDATGQPVPDGELAVVVVDEAILALTNYQLADPLSAFYPDRPSYLESLFGRSSIVLVDPQALANAGLAAQEAVKTVEVQRDMAMPAAAPQPTMAASLQNQAAAAPEPIRVRVNFNPLATFAPAVHTDRNGEARIPITLPDNLTRYRIMVVAVDRGGKRFGMGESNLVARLPLMARPSAPRFLNFGDRFELPVVLQNQTDTPLDVEVVVRTNNLELITTESDYVAYAGLRVTVPARDRIEVRFPATTAMAGTARVQIAAVSGNYADAANVDLPVYTPATTEAFATYGVLDAGAVNQLVMSPSGVFPQYGGLEISTSSTALQALTDAVLYLVSYPFECTEQLSSRILAIAALRDVLTAFKAEGLPSPDAMETAVSRDIERLQGMQNADGGFPYWRRGFDSIPFNTIHVAHALVRAQSKGFTVPAAMQLQAFDYLRSIENYYPTYYGQQTRWTLSAYALYVRNLQQDRDSQKALKLLTEAGLENLSLEAIGWLWPVLDDQAQLEAIRRYVNNRVVETAGAANFTTSYDDQTYLMLSSDRRTDAILLDAMIGDDIASGGQQKELIAKLVNGLLAHRIKGRWGSTQENVFVLIALDRYFNTYETQTPDFVARLWLGNTYVGSSEFQGRTTENHEIVIPMPYVISETLAGGGTQNLILSKEGPGRLYYRLGLNYAPTNLHLDPLDMGFAVQRKYEAIDNPEDVSQDENGVWHIRAGARVRVRITMVATNRRYHVALVDPLPAGLEIVNPALAVSGGTPQDPTTPRYRYGWWSWTWFEHQNLRDESAEAFTSLLWEGVYEYTYIARAITPGTFVVPPAKAEEMYSPEVFGRSSSDWVVVEEK